MTNATTAAGWPQPYRLVNAEPYWAELMEHRLTYQRCGSCNEVVWPAHYLCPECSADNLHWERSSGKGRVYSWSTIFRGPTPVWASVAPYTVGFVEMAEGYFLFAQLDAEPGTVEAGAPVEVRYIVRGEQVLPVFALVEEGRST